MRRAGSVAALDVAVAGRWEQFLDAAWGEYNADRAAADWFRRCLGKQTLSRIAAALEFRSGEAIERQVVALWDSGEVAPPPDLVDLRTYVGALGG